MVCLIKIEVTESYIWERWYLVHQKSTYIIYWLLYLKENVHLLMPVHM